jgi:hypothetical protein
MDGTNALSLSLSLSLLTDQPVLDSIAESRGPGRLCVSWTYRPDPSDNNLIFHAFDEFIVRERSDRSDVVGHCCDGSMDHIRVAV